MIKNDEQFKETFKKYVKSKGIEYVNFCRGIDCEDCILGNQGIYCDGEPFNGIEEYNKKIGLLKKEIEIMEMWEAETESDLVREIRDICNTLKSRAKEPKCPTDDCEKCPFYNINSFSFWLIYTRNQMNRKKRGEENDSKRTINY